MYNIIHTAPYFLLIFGIAFLPIFFKKRWHKLENPFLGIILALSVFFIFDNLNTNNAIKTIAQTIIHDYIPFIAIAFALFITSSCIHIKLNVRDSIKNNVLILIAGSLIASIIGTTGTSVMLIRPFLLLNKHKAFKAHYVLFFIIIVSNIGGCLSPLGDPPLFFGYLKGVDFSWNIIHTFKPFCVCIVYLLLIFIAIEKLFNGKSISQFHSEHAKTNIEIQGVFHLFLLILIVCITIYAPYLKKDINFYILNVKVNKIECFRDLSYLLIAIIAYFSANKNTKHQNHFSFKPIIEVVKIFLVIFLSLIPVFKILDLNTSGDFAKIFEVLRDASNINACYFWLSGLMSAFLDNAPTYLLFLKITGKDVVYLMKDVNQLLAISMGSVFMGCITYIGNAPNLMVRNISKQYDFYTLDFISYLIASIVLMFPLFYIIQILFL